MKTTCAVFLLFAASATAQTPFERIEVVAVDSTTDASIMLSSARLWIANAFPNAEAVIQVDDPVTNRIVGKASSAVNTYNALDFTMEISCRTGRCRIKLYDVTHRGIGGIQSAAGYAPAPSIGPMWDEERCYVPMRSSALQSEKAAERNMKESCAKWRPVIREKLEALVQSFGTSLHKTAASDKTDDW